MLKHILGMSWYQSIIIFAVVFGGHKFFPEKGEGKLEYMGGANCDATCQKNYPGLTPEIMAKHPI